MRSLSARSVLLVLAVVALVALAGCSGGDDGTTTDPGELTDAPTDEMTTTQEDTGGEMTTEDDAGEETTAEDDGTSDDGTTGDGVTSESIFGDHTEAVSEAGSFTANVSIQLNSSQQDIAATTVTYADMDTGDGYQRSDVESSFLSQSTEVYTSGDETWQRTEDSFSEGVQYNYSSAPYDGQVQPVNTTQAASGNFQFGDTDLTWSEAGTETVDGVETTRYTADGIDNPEQASSLIGTNVTSVDNIELEAFVDDDGVVRRLVLDFTGETEQAGQITQQLDYELTDIGSTEIPTPEWLDEAREQTGS